MTINGVFESAETAVHGSLQLMLKYHWDDVYEECVRQAVVETYVTVLKKDGRLSLEIPPKISWTSTYTPLTPS